MMAMTYGNVYVARVAMGAKDAQTINALKEADAFPGTSLIVAYSHCIAHGYDMGLGLDQQTAAVDSGYWPLFRFDPRRADAGESPLKLDSGAPKMSLMDYVSNENRYRQVQQATPEAFTNFIAQAQKTVRERYALYEQLARAMHPDNLVPGAANGTPKAKA